MHMLALAANDTVVAPAAISAAQYLSIVIGFVIPVLVALVTKHSTSATAKSVLLLLLSGVSGFLTEWVTALNNASVFNWQQALLGSLLTFGMGVAAYFGLWSPTGIDARLKDTLVRDRGEGGAGRSNVAVLVVLVVAVVVVLFLIL